MVYRVGVLPDVRASAAIWREVCRREGIGDLYLCAAKTYDTGDPSQYGFDALVEFPPHGVRTPPINAEIDFMNPDFDGQVVDYRRFVLDSIAAAPPPYRVHRYGHAGLGQYGETSESCADVRQFDAGSL